MKGVFLFALSLAALGACSTATPPATQPAIGNDSSSDASTADVTPAIDAQNSTCEDACKTLSFALDLNGKRVTFDRAQFGGSANRPHIELYQGGDPKCPDQMSPTPTYTLLVNFETDGGLPTAVFFDYKGDVLTGGGAPFVKATAVEARVTHGQDGSFTGVDASLAFALGTGTGRIYATHCTSLD
jgi:zona occludens toxin (predicted ATPase)